MVATHRCLAGTKSRQHLVSCSGHPLSPTSLRVPFEQETVRKLVLPHVLICIFGCTGCHHQSMHDNCYRLMTHITYPYLHMIYLQKWYIITVTYVPYFAPSRFHFASKSWSDFRLSKSLLSQVSRLLLFLLGFRRPYLARSSHEAMNWRLTH